jgi:transcriptional antiterminator NusG
LEQVERIERSKGKMQRKWYAIYAFPGYEHRVRVALLRKIREKKMESFFGEVIVPTERIVEIAHGQKRIVEQRMFPGYLLAQLDLTDEVWHLIRSIPKVKGLVGKGHYATALSDVEVQGILDRMEAAAAKPRRKTSFTVGETVKIVDGPFRDFTGIVEEFVPERSRLKVLISVFGRPTPVVLDSVHAEAA